MQRLTDEELINELKRKFEENRKMLDSVVTMNKKLEILNKKLQESEAMKSNFLSNIKNEINNPLTSIITLTGHLMTAGNMDSKELDDIYKMIHSESSYLDFQLRNILMAAEIESGELNLNYSNVNVTSVVESILSLYKHIISEKSLQINYHGENDIRFVTDSDKLRFILFNLISNAVEFSNVSGTIDITCSVDDKRLDVTIRNEGMGIAHKDQQMIFDRFRQIDTGHRKAHRGNGLGLSVTRAILEFTGGDISVESEPEKFARFSFYIPQTEMCEEVSALPFDDGEIFIFNEGDEKEF